MAPNRGRWAWAGVGVGVLLVMAVGPAQGRPILSEFNYAFDAGGEIHGFIHNTPEEGGAVSWHAGGALGSTGCLKVTGPFATTDTRFEWFRAGDSTISFHYYVHGYAGLRCRLNVARPEDVQRYGRYGNHPVKPLVQDKWQFVQLKIADVAGDAKGSPKAYADLVFKTVSFIASDRGGEDAYLLIDNVRLGPPIEAKDIQVEARGHKVVGKASRLLLDFENDADAALVHSTDADVVKMSASDHWAGRGKRSLKLLCRRGEAWTAFELDKSLLAGWEKFDYLAFDLYSEDANFVTLTTELWDPATRGYPTRSTYGGEVPEMKVGPAHKGVTRVRMDLRYARRNGKEGLAFHELREGDRIDLSRLTKVKAWFSTQALKSDYVVYLDNVRLLQEGALETNMKIALPAGAVAFDFGEGSPLVEGFTEASIVDLWGPGKEYGFVKPEGLRARGRDWPDPLTGDFVGPAAGGPDEQPKPASFEFRVRVPNGRYAAWVAAGSFPSLNLYTDLNVNGQMLFSAEMTPQRFYTQRWHFRFLETLYSEKPQALWRDCVAVAYPARVVVTEVTGGEFYVKGANAYLSALILLPAARLPELDKLADQIASERARYFYRDLYLQRPANEPCRIADEHFALFAPAEGKDVMPWSGIDRADGDAIRKVAAPGQAVCFQAAVRPFRDAESLKLSVSDLQGPGSARIAAKDVRVFLKRYISNGERVRPWCLLPRDTVPLEKGLTRAFWLRLHVPTDATAGVYKGAITAAAGGASRRLDVAIQVYPVRLVEDIPLAIGFYYSPPDSGQWVGFDRANDFAAERDQILRQQMEIMRDYGMTSTHLPAPSVTGLRGSGVTLDLAATEKVAAAAKAAGLLANEKQKAMVYTLSIGRAIARRIAGARQSGSDLALPGFGPAYVSGVMQLVEWAQTSRTPLALWVVDEPRENPNPWNRNLADTIGYLKLTAQVPGAIRMVTPMGDTNSGKDYTPMLDHLEIVATHATKSSARMIQRGMSDPKIELWIYNVGKDRFSNGFYLWSIGAGGKHEWHFNQWVDDSSGGYPGRDMHNPLLNYQFTSATVPAPLSFQGALLPREGLLTMSQGAADYRWLCTLQQALDRCRAQAGKAVAVAEADAFLQALRKVIPVLPDVKNLARPEDLALVGEGIQGGAEANLEAWRGRVAELTVKLQGTAND